DFVDGTPPGFAVILTGRCYLFSRIWACTLIRRLRTRGAAGARAGSAAAGAGPVTFIFDSAVLAVVTAGPSGSIFRCALVARAASDLTHFGRGTVTVQCTFDASAI